MDKIPDQVGDDSADVLQPIQWPIPVIASSFPSWPAHSRHGQLIPVMAGPDRPSLFFLQSFRRVSPGRTKGLPEDCKGGYGQGYEDGNWEYPPFFGKGKSVGELFEVAAAEPY